MITKDYLHSTSLEPLAVWLAGHAVPQFFAEVTYENAQAICRDSIGNEMLSLKLQNGLQVKVTRIDGSSASITYGTVDTIAIACACSTGILLRFLLSSAPSFIYDLAIVKNNHDRTAFIFGSAEGSAQNRLTLNLRRIAYDDTSTVTGFTFSPLAADQTQLVPFCTDAALGTTSYTPDAFYMPVGQYFGMGLGKFTANGDDYLSNGYWAFRDAPSD